MAAHWDGGFCVREASWHGLETLLQDWPKDIDEALPLGFPRRDGAPGHWEPIAEPMYRKVISVSDKGGLIEEYMEVPDRKLIVRDDVAGADGVLGAGTSDYEIIGNRTFTEIGEALMDQGFKIDTLFSTREGAEIGATLRLDEPLVIAGDDTNTFPFLCLTSSHNLTRACRAGYLWYRVLCANTVAGANMVWDSGKAPSFTFAHTTNVKDRIEEAKAVLAGAKEATAAFVALSEELAAMPCLDDQLAEYLERAVPIPDVLPNGEVIGERKKNNLVAQRSQIRSLYEDSVTTEGHRGTALGLVDATVEYLDHYRRSASQESLVRRTLFETEAAKTAAFDLAREVCSAN